MRQHPFELHLSVGMENTEFTFRGMPDFDWTEFYLNPRRLRGSDFLMRWSQGGWSEKRLREAVNATAKFYAIAYGPSSVAPEDIREHELYFERLENAGLGDAKRPDLLSFNSKDKPAIESFISGVGGEQELPFIQEEKLSNLLNLSLLAVECENSLWVAHKMPDYGTKLKPMKRLSGKPGLRKSAILPTVIIKEEDREPLRQWQKNSLKPDKEVLKILEGLSQQ